MIEHLLSYSFEDFMPIDAATYLRLLERVNESLWPMQCVSIVFGLWLLYLIKRSQDKFIWPLIAVAWIFSGVYFHGVFLSELNWAASYFSWAFVVQGGLFLLILLKTDKPTISKPQSFIEVLVHSLGQLIFLIGLIVFPTLSLITQKSWAHTEWFGVMPDPTCVATFGLFLLFRNLPWWLLPLPIVWSCIAGATGYVFELATGIAVFITCAVMFVLLLWRRLACPNKPVSI